MKGNGSQWIATGEANRFPFFRRIPRLFTILDSSPLAGCLVGDGKTFYSTNTPKCCQIGGIQLLPLYEGRKNVLIRRQKRKDTCNQTCDLFCAHLKRATHRADTALNAFSEFSLTHIVFLIHFIITFPNSSLLYKNIFFFRIFFEWYFFKLFRLTIPKIFF